MNDKKTFPLSLDFEGRRYNGEIEASEERGKNGAPIFFRITLDGKFFAYLCCGDFGWKERDDLPRPKGLIDAIGQYILDHYE